MPEELLLESETLNWQHFDDPEDPELVVLAAHRGFHELALEDCGNLSQRAKMDDYGDHLFFVFNTLHFEHQERLSLGKLCIFAGDNYVVTVCSGISNTVLTVKSKMSGGHVYDSPASLVYALLDFVCDQFQPLIDEISEDIGEMEAEVFVRPSREASLRALNVKRALISLRRVAAAHRQIISQLLRRDPPFVDSRLNIYFRDIFDHLLLALELIEANRDLTLGLIDVNLTATAHRTNEIVKGLTLFATVLLPLNLITGFFGMNFYHMPLVTEWFGLPLVAAVMLITTFVTAHYLKSRAW